VSGLKDDICFCLITHVTCYNKMKNIVLHVDKAKFSSILKFSINFSRYVAVVDMGGNVCGLFKVLSWNLPKGITKPQKYHSKWPHLNNVTSQIEVRCVTTANPLNHVYSFH